MIKVTLEFSTIPELLGFFGQAKMPLAAGLALDSGEFIPAAELNKAAKPKATPAPQTQSPAAQTAAQAATGASNASSKQASESPAKDALDYPTLQKAMFALAGKSREAAGAVVATLGVASLKVLDQSRWPEALAAINAKMAELEAA